MKKYILIAGTLGSLAVAAAMTPPTTFTEHLNVKTWIPTSEPGADVEVPLSPDSPLSLFHADGNWDSPYCVDVGKGKGGEISVSNVTFTQDTGSSIYHMNLIVHANTCDAGEVVTNEGWTWDQGAVYPFGQDSSYGYGYYQCVMKAAPVGSKASNTGVVSSCFVKTNPWNGPNNVELDIPEILGNDRTGGAPYIIHITTHSPGLTNSQAIQVPFDPAEKYHLYAVLFTPGQAAYYVDNVLVQTDTNSTIISDPQMGMAYWANTWTGNKNWGGLPPSTDAFTEYHNFKYWANVTSPPEEAMQELPDGVNMVEHYEPSDFHVLSEDEAAEQGIMLDRPETPRR